jgi:hypothetical protein
MKKKPSLPAWVFILGILGLIIAIISGYFYGTESVAIYKEMMEGIVIKDTNGEDTSLTALDFTNFIGVYDNEFGYNFFDTEMSFALSYNSTVKYNNSKGVYPNDFSGSANVSYRVDFDNFNHYDVSYAKRSEKETVFTFSSRLESGNLEARILRIDDNYRIKADEFGRALIDPAYIHEVAIFTANSTLSVTLPGGSIYLLAVGCENADGYYTFKAE